MTWGEAQSDLYDMIVEQLGVEKSELKDTSSFMDDLGADSLDAVELIMSVEDQFKITVEDDEAESLTTVGDICSMLRQKLNL